MGIWHKYAINEMILTFKEKVRVWLIVIDAQFFFKLRWFLLFLVATRLICEAMCTTPNK